MIKLLIMTDFFSEILHVSQVYTLPNEDKPLDSDEPKNKEEAESGQVLISQRTRKRNEQDQIDEIINLYKKDSKDEDEDDNESQNKPPEPTFNILK
jgi:hypothetical protein